MTTHQQITLGVILATTAGLIVFDVWAAWAWGNDATISVVLWRLGWAAPLVPFAFGVLFGHLFGLPLLRPYLLGFALGVLLWGQGRDARFRGWFRGRRRDEDVPPAA